MLNQYEGSAVAESNEGIGALAADNAAEQQPSLPDEMSTAQMLYSVVAHNVANPDKRIALSPEQGKEIMRDFVDFVAGSNEPPTTEDGRIKTFGEMDDNELLKCLSEYLASGVSNTSINGAIIETAQEMIAEQYMSEEELEDLPDPKTPRAREIRDRKLLEKMREAAEEMEKQLKETRDKWDQDTHDYGGQQLTGAEIMERIDWFSKKENQDKVRNELIKEGKSQSEADRIIAETLEYNELVKRDRDGKLAKPPLSVQERARMEELAKKEDVRRALLKTEELGQFNRQISKERDSVKSQYTEKGQLLAEQTDLSQKEKSGILSERERSRLAELNKDSSLKEAAAFIDQVSSVAKKEATSSVPSEAYAHFSSAPHIGEAFDAVASQTNSNIPDATPQQNINQKPEPATITTAKVDATAAAFM